MGTNVHEPDRFSELFDSGQFNAAQQLVLGTPFPKWTRLTWQRLAMCELMKPGGLSLALDYADNGVVCAPRDYIPSVLRDVALHLVRFQPSGMLTIRFSYYNMTGGWSELLDLIMDELEVMPNDQNTTACYMMIRGRKLFALGDYHGANTLHDSADAMWRKEVTFPDVQWMMNNRYHWYLARVGCDGAWRSRTGLTHNLCSQIIERDPNWKRKQIVRIIWWFGRPALRLVR